MTYIIGKACVDVMDGACVDVCPVDCIYSKEGDNQLFINPEECIDCAACEPHVLKVLFLLKTMSKMIQKSL